jgi:serine/threonine protein kinase
MPPVPKTIGRYDIVELVGRGGMGVLYRARDPQLERDVALKMMHVDFTLDTTARERFQREARAIARLQHRNVVTIHELGEVEGAPYIVMEFLGGQDLEALLKSGDYLRMSLPQKLDIAIQLCEGLAYAHEQGIVHRDIKPGNVRVLEDGSVKILDFGIAKFAMSSVTQSATVLGTPSYMAPEQIMSQPVDGRADLFAAGVLLYELLSGKKPFPGDSPTSVVYQIMHAEPAPLRESLPDLPDALQQIITRALQKNPNERYSRASEMASDLQTVKMMFDLPLHGSGTGPLSTSSTAVTTVVNPPLYANTMRSRTDPSGSNVLNAPMRTSAVAATADAAPRARDEDKRSGLLWIGAGAGVVLVAVAIMVFALQGSNDGASSGAGGGAGGGTQTAGGRGAEGDGAAASAGGGATTTTALPTEIDLASQPRGASIVLNGIDTKQQTPAKISIAGQSLPARVVLSRQGYKALEAEITEADVRAGRKEFTLAIDARPVRLTVSGPFEFELVQGSKVVSTAASSHDLTVQPGAPVVARNREKFVSQTLNIDFTRAQASFTLEPLGVLMVRGNPACTVVVDGQPVGQPPIPDLQVGSGSHTVVLKCAGQADQTQRATVPAGGKHITTFSGRN